MAGGEEVVGRVAGFDPSQNVLMLTGSNGCTNQEPYIWLYRYGNGAGASYTAAGGGGSPPETPTPPTKKRKYRNNHLDREP